MCAKFHGDTIMLSGRKVHVALSKTLILGFFDPRTGSNADRKLKFSCIVGHTLLHKCVKFHGDMTMLSGRKVHVALLKPKFHVFLRVF